MKRVLIFSLAYYPRVGGAEVAVKEITDRISPEDVAFDMITLRFDPQEKDVETVGNVRVYRVKYLERLGYLSKILFPLFAAMGARRLHAKYRYDAAWAMMSYMVFPLVLLRVLGVRIPYVLNLQDGDPFDQVFNRWFILPLRPLLVCGLRRAAVVQVLSSYLAGWARTVGYRGHIEVIPNGADTRRFANAPAINFGRNEEEVWLVTASRLVHKNAIDDVIRALPRLPAHVKFLILGVGEEEKNLKALAQKLGVSGKIMFKGYVSHKELPGYLRASDIFIRPSRTEGFGASFVEAMAAGLPVIATQEGGIADFLFDAKRNPERAPTGWAVDKDSPGQIAAAVKDILGNPEVTAQVVENARKLAVGKYDWDLIARDMRQKVFARLF